MAPSIRSRRDSPRHTKWRSRIFRYGLVFVLGRASIRQFRPDLQAFELTTDSQEDRNETLQLLVLHNASLPGTSAPPKPSDPNVFNLTTTRGVAAALLIKDDNHWLIEWLAYHYHVLPLRHLVVTIDPDSKTSPRKILDRWKGLMRIDIWEEKVFKKPIPHAFRKKYNYRNNSIQFQLMISTSNQ
jgi:hypothetical protein